MVREAVLVAAVTAGRSLLGLLEAWEHDRNKVFAALLFGAVGLIFGLIAVGVGRRR
jgi:hypothetical protein